MHTDALACDDRQCLVCRAYSCSALSAGEQCLERSMQCLERFMHADAHMFAGRQCLVCHAFCLQCLTWAHQLVNEGDAAVFDAQNTT
eukprot:scaffold2231_cov18-Tisochrysis_lutea.AAC.1